MIDKARRMFILSRKKAILITDSQKRRACLGRPEFRMNYEFG